MLRSNQLSYITGGKIIAISQRQGPRLAVGEDRLALIHEGVHTFFLIGRRK